MSSIKIPTEGPTLEEDTNRIYEMNEIASHRDENDLGRLGKVQVLKV